MAQESFNDEVQIPEKLRKRLRRYILLNPELLAYLHYTDDNSDYTPDSVMATEAKRKIVKYQVFIDGHPILGFEDLEEVIQNQMSEIADVVDRAEQAIIHKLSSLTLSQEDVVSSRERHDFANRNRVLADDDQPLNEWSIKPLRPFMADFVRWIEQSSIEHHDKDWSGRNYLDLWSSEDWESDITYVMRGYFIAKNQRKGFSLNNVKTIADALELAKPFIPKEGLEVTRAALLTVPHLNAATKIAHNNIWLDDLTEPATIPDGMDAPQIGVIHADDDYILMHLKNETAAIVFGAKTAWCTARGSFNEYADNLLFLCDAAGNRYQLSFTQGQIMDEADEVYSYAKLKARYDGLGERIAQFHSDALDTEIAYFKSTYDGQGKARTYDYQTICSLTSDLVMDTDILIDDFKEILMGYSQDQIIDAVKVIYATRQPVSVPDFILFYNDMDKERAYQINSALLGWHLDNHLNGAINRMPSSARIYQIEELLLIRMASQNPEQTQSMLQDYINRADANGDTIFMGDIEHINDENDLGLDLDFTQYGCEKDFDDDNLRLSPDDQDRYDALSEHAEGHMHPSRGRGPA